MPLEGLPTNIASNVSIGGISLASASVSLPNTPVAKVSFCNVPPSSTHSGVSALATGGTSATESMVMVAT